jgi:hypothetical protein
MILGVAATDARAGRVERELSGGGSGWITPYLGCTRTDGGKSAGPGEGQPQAFLVEQSPGSAVAPHFHLQDQFQLVVRGGGTLGHHPVRCISLHYAKRHNGYGPIVAGPEGLAYFTIRRHGDQGAWYLPASSRAMDRSVPRRQLVGGPILPARPDSLLSLGAPKAENLLPKAADGIAAWCLSAPPGQPFPECPGLSTQDRFVITIAGLAMLDDRSFGPLSALFLSAGESPQICAGADGAQIVVLTFGDTAQR